MHQNKQVVTSPESNQAQKTTDRHGQWKTDLNRSQPVCVKALCWSHMTARFAYRSFKADHTEAEGA